ncbi:MAG: DUF503 domain-containing protein [Chloroflexi bacterium]|nr:DUF503 domain-containing protein [Chloroflexota bacterium]
MHVGILTIRLHLPENRDLKGKRQVVRPLLERVRSRFNVAAAEIEDLDKWQSAVLGIAAVGNDGAHVNEVLSHVIVFVERTEHDAMLSDYSIELMTV